MTFHTSSFFMGVGTVVTTMAVGFGAGVMMTGSLLGNNEIREPSRLAQRVTVTKAESELPVAHASQSQLPHRSQVSPDPHVAVSPTPEALAGPASSQDNRTDIVIPSQPSKQPLQPIGQSNLTNNGSALDVDARKIEEKRRAKRLAERRAKERPAQAARTNQEQRQNDAANQPRIVSGFASEPSIFEISDDD